MSRRPSNRITLTFTIEPTEIADCVAAVRRTAKVEGLINFDENYDKIVETFVNQLQARMDWGEEMLEKVNEILYHATEDLHDEYWEFYDAEAARAVKS